MGGATRFLAASLTCALCPQALAAVALLAAPAHGMNMRVGQQSGSATSGSAYAACVSASPTSGTASASIYVARALTYSTSSAAIGRYRISSSVLYSYLNDTPMKPLE